MKNFCLRTTMLLAASATLALQSCKKEEAPDRELILAGDIENAAVVRSHWWRQNEGDKHALEITNEASYSPSNSLKISARVADPSFVFWAQIVNWNIPTGKEVTLKVKIKGSLEGQGVSLVIRGDDTVSPEGNAEQFVSTQDIAPITGTFDWQEHSVTLGKVGNHIKSLTVYLVYLPHTTGEVYFDNVSLTY